MLSSPIAPEPWKTTTSGNFFAGSLFNGFSRRYFTGILFFPVNAEESKFTLLKLRISVIALFRDSVSVSFFILLQPYSGSSAIKAIDAQAKSRVKKKNCFFMNLFHAFPPFLKLLRF